MYVQLEGDDKTRDDKTDSKILASQSRNSLSTVPLVSWLWSTRALSRVGDGAPVETRQYLFFHSIPCFAPPIGRGNSPSKSLAFTPARGGSVEPWRYSTLVTQKAGTLVMIGTPRQTLAAAAAGWWVVGSLDHTRCGLSEVKACHKCDGPKSFKGSKLENLDPQ